jgi:anti-sigma-K factor RskA
MTDDDLHDDPTLERVERMLRTAGPPPEPSAELRARLLEIPRLESRPTPTRPDRWRRLWGSLPAWRMASAGLALAAVVLAIVAVVGTDSGGSFSGPSVTMGVGPGYRASGVAVSMISDDTRHIRIRIDGLPRLEGNSVYELWIARDPAHRVSLGIFRPDAQGRIDTTVSVPNLGPAWQGIWLTHEPGSGRPGWSKDWVLAGKLA